MRITNDSHDGWDIPELGIQLAPGESADLPEPIGDVEVPATIVVDEPAPVAEGE